MSAYLIIIYVYYAMILSSWVAHTQLGALYIYMSVCMSICIQDASSISITLCYNIICLTLC